MYNSYIMQVHLTAEPYACCLLLVFGCCTPTEVAAHLRQDLYLARHAMKIRIPFPAGILFSWFYQMKFNLPELFVKRAARIAGNSSLCG